NVLRSLRCQGWITLLVEADQLSRDHARGFVIAHIIDFEKFDRLLLDVGQRGAYLPKTHCPVYGTVRKLERVSRTIVAVHALHSIARRFRDGLFGYAIRDERNSLGSIAIPVLHPRDVLTFGVDGSVIDLHSRIEMLAVYSAQIAATGEHHQNRLCLGVCSIVFKVENHASLGGLELLRPMAPFTSAGRGDQAVAFHRRFNWVVNAMENHIH